MGWNQLLDTIKENRQIAEQEAAEPPVACPIDGALLDVHADGRRNCPMGNYRWPEE